MFYYLGLCIALLASSLSLNSACISGGRRAAEPATCRIFTETCLPEVCQQLKVQHWIDCDQDGMRQRVREKLGTCDDYNTCFNDLVTFNQITPANCRSKPDLCLVYACDNARSLYSINCDVDDNKNRMRELLKNCRAPTVDHCLSGVSSWKSNRAVIVTITPAECRKNPESCLPYACEYVSKIGQTNCDSGNTKDRVKLLLSNCRAPQVDICLNEASNWQLDNFMPITPANCRSKPDKCISYACTYLETKNWVPCSSGNTVDRLIELMKNCRAPNLDICLNGASNWIRSFEITPANCRSKPDSCINNYGCQFVESKNWAKCSSGDTKNRLRSLLVNCRDPTVDLCLNEASKWGRVAIIRDSFTISPANCRSKPDDCISYGCQFIESKNWAQCSESDIRSRLRSLFSNCRAPNVDFCLNEASKWKSTTTSVAITPANCRSKPEQCMGYACNKVQQLHGKYCSDSSVRNIVADQLKNCRAPTVDMCLQRFPITTLPSRATVVISPSICSKDPEKCMPYACDKVKKDYGKDCSSNNAFRAELQNLLQRCADSVSVDLCLTNVPYEINV